MKVKNAREVRKILREKFGGQALKNLGVKVETHGELGIVYVDIERAIATRTEGKGNSIGEKNFFDKRLTENERELIRFVENNTFKLY